VQVAVPDHDYGLVSRTRAAGGVSTALVQHVEDAFERLRHMRATTWLPIVAAFFALRALLGHWGLPVGKYDEALLFTDAYLLSRGETIYRDFYVNYPPGIMQLVRAVMALPIPTVWSCRLLATAAESAPGPSPRRSCCKRGCTWSCSRIQSHCCSR
jgi:hypothetical protein